MKHYRDELIISTKPAMKCGPALTVAETAAENICLQALIKACSECNLIMWIFFYHHCLDPETPLEETMGALATAVQSGKALYAGISNYDGETLEKACKILTDLKCPFIINQNRYSVFDRTIENNGLKETAARLNKGIIAFSPLAQGLLTNRYLNGIPADSRIATDGRYLKESAITPEKLEKIKALSKIAERRGQTLAEMALAWVLKDGVVTSVLIGASKPSQILDNIKAIQNTSFSAEELEEIDELSI